uniref:Uncharacterized protein n=1 Tax=Coturnix japonica TaxID=93934 RepID=A0A8C2SQ95_COTJA
MKRLPQSAAGWKASPSLSGVAFCHRFSPTLNLCAHISCSLSPSFLLSWPFPSISPGDQGRKMVGTAVGFSSRCWSSSRREKLSLVKCSLQRNEYLVGVQLSLCTAFSHWIRRFESFRGNLRAEETSVSGASRAPSRPRC